MASDVPFEAADCFSFAFAFASSAFDVGGRARVVFASVVDDLVQDAVEFAVAAAVEPVTDGLA